MHTAYQESQEAHWALPGPGYKFCVIPVNLSHQPHRLFIPFSHVRDPKGVARRRRLMRLQIAARGFLDVLAVHEPLSMTAVVLWYVTK